MNRYRRITMFVLCLAGLTIRQAQADSCFYYKERVFPLTVSSNRIVIQLDSMKPAATPGEFYARHPCLNASASIEPLHGGFAVYSLGSAWAFASAAADLFRDSVVHRVIPVYFSPPYSGELKYTDVIDVRFRAGLSIDSMLALVRSVGLHFVDSNTFVHGLWRCALDDSVRGSPVEYGNRLHALDGTVWASATFSAVASPQTLVHDPYFSHQYYLENTDSSNGRVDVDIDADSAWMVPLLRPTLTVAVIDEGVEPHARDLPGVRILPGYDAVGDSLFQHGIQPDNDPTPGRIWAHGEACAGILGASHNSNGIMGVIGSCNIIPVKIADNLGNWPDIRDYPWVYADAIRWAARNGARVLSCSWAVNLPWVPVIADAIEDVVDSCGTVMAEEGLPPCHGCVMVFPTGNDADHSPPIVHFPGNMPQVIAVGAINRYGNLWNYSDYGNEIDVVAPSGSAHIDGDQWTTDMVGNRGWNPTAYYGPGGDWDYTNRMGGTSGAVPQVAGIAALVLARRPDLDSLYRDALGNDTLPRVIRRIVDSSAVDWGADSLPGFDTVFGYGLANAYRALLSVIHGDFDNSGGIDAADVSAMANYCFRVESPPTLDKRVADTDCDGDADICDYLRTLAAKQAGTGIAPCFKF